MILYNKLVLCHQFAATERAFRVCNRCVALPRLTHALLNGCPNEVAQCGPDLSTNLTYAKRMRDFLAHQYFAVDPARTWDTIQKDLGRLLNCVAILQALLP